MLDYIKTLFSISYPVFMCKCTSFADRVPAICAIIMKVTVTYLIRLGSDWASPSQLLV